MKQMGAGLPGMPGMPGMGKRGRAKAASKSSQVKRGKKGRSGNPAKRAEQEAAASLTKPAGSGLRLGADTQGVPGRDPLATQGEMPELPDELKKLLGG